MQLFKTEMLCLHPPRTRRFYGPYGERGLRYGGRIRPRGASIPPRVRDDDRVVSCATQETQASPDAFDRAA